MKTVKDVSWEKGIHEDSKGLREREGKEGGWEEVHGGSEGDREAGRVEENVRRREGGQVRKSEDEKRVKIKQAKYWNVSNAISHRIM